MNKVPAELRLLVMKKQMYLVLFAALLGVIYVIFFTDLTAKKEIQIKYGNLRSMDDNAPPGVFFRLDHPYQLVSVKVVSVSDAATNKTPHTLWHLVAQKKPAKITGFAYGHPIPGMAPFVAGTAPEPLQPDEKYRLIVQDDKKVSGEINFDPP